ncbi:MAG: hypothetical protein ACFB11_22010 [Paracoccaceae bacterium]
MRQHLQPVCKAHPIGTIRQNPLAKKIAFLRWYQSMYGGSLIGKSWVKAVIPIGPRQATVIDANLRK